jgi:hypothetical protein
VDPPPLLFALLLPPQAANVKLAAQQTAARALRPESIALSSRWFIAGAS